MDWNHSTSLYLNSILPLLPIIFHHQLLKYHCPDAPSYLRQLTRAGLLVLYINPIYPGQRVMLPLYAKDTDRQHRLCDDNSQNKITQTYFKQHCFMENTSK